ncbi:hypothetical protein PRIPAC_95457 [Pristionchus pacificus]|uniref:Uncharacterized protein n=1 Tax=Pristionchus pacificus TaxID=54126 RepID=A0A2A6CUL7_PRIPA|nr:hypothetical protein PRIPAC_95457 [Pristionchus pacificus]|eukprot:PDM81849.1 hypothetical protein PRIPAC_34003 [Pristionchus pacificus]
MDADKSQRGAYITGPASDFIVRRFLEQKEHLLHWNARGASNGAALRRNAAESVTTEFNKIFPTLDKTFEQLRDHFTKRRDGLKKLFDVAIEKLKNPSEIDGLIIQYLKKTDFLGVGPESLETGWALRMENNNSKPMEMTVDDDDEDAIEILDQRKKVRPSKSGKLSRAGFEKARVQSQAEWIRSVAQPMSDRAASMGYGPKKRSHSDGEFPKEKKSKMESEDSVEILNTAVSSVNLLTGQLAAISAKADAGAALAEQLRALVKYGQPTREHLEDMLSSYVCYNIIDAKVQSATSSKGSPMDNVISLP